MALTFPIDKKEPSEIPAFTEIFLDFSMFVPDLNDMLKYLCYRFDPKSPVFDTSIVTYEERVRKAEELSGWVMPEPLMHVDEGGNNVVDTRYQLFSEVMGSFFSVLDNDEWEFIVSLDVAIHNGHMVIREPLPACMDPETKGKVQINIYKAIEGTAKALKERKAKAMELAQNDERAANAILSGTKKSTQRKREPISPEGFLNNET